MQANTLIWSQNLWCSAGPIQAAVALLLHPRLQVPVIHCLLNFLKAQYVWIKAFNFLQYPRVSVGPVQVLWAAITVQSVGVQRQQHITG